MLQWNQLQSSLLPLRSPPSLNPFLVPPHTLALVLAQPQITQEPFNLQPWKYSLFFSRFIFCHCSALNWLQSAQRSLSECLSSAEHTKEGGWSRTFGGGSDELKLVRSSHEITSCTMERKAGNERVNPPQASRANTPRTSGDADDPATSQKQDLCTMRLVSTTSYYNELQMQLCITQKWAALLPSALFHLLKG